MYRITYKSHASRVYSRQSLSAITAVSRRNNLRHEVTGLLVYYDRRFFQVLEGEREVLVHLMTRIVADPRHRAMEMIDHGPADQRAFNTWRLCCAPQDAPLQASIPATPLRELVPANSDLRGRDPGVRRHVRQFLAGLKELPATAVG